MKGYYNKKNLMVVLVCIILVSTSISITYADTNYSDWAKNYIVDSIAMELLPNELQSNYKDNISRAEFSTLMVQMIEKHKKTSLDFSNTTFIDTTNTDVLKIAKTGIVVGKDTGLFDPNGDLSREQIAAIIINAYEYLTPGSTMQLSVTHKFEDAQKVGAWAKNYISKAYDLKILTGYNNSINPKGLVTKEQAIAIVKKMYDYYHPETASKAYVPAITKLSIDPYFNKKSSTMIPVFNSFFNTTKILYKPWQFEVYVFDGDQYTGIILGGIDPTNHNYDENFNVVVFDLKTKYNTNVTAGGINMYSKLSEIKKIYGTNYTLYEPTYKPSEYDGTIDDLYSIVYELGDTRQLIINSYDKDFNDIIYIKYVGPRN